jgi:hypothetical protein
LCDVEADVVNGHQIPKLLGKMIDFD